ncbi:DUF7158 domain-containing protein [Catenulispora subtropica]|uniref:PpiC domain-containing protein n=1 Tax=Catenulispora subtropica TaxID=450798 RepID=A0ABP5EII6_9ACTN
MTVIGRVDGAPIPRERLDERVAELRAGRFAGRLPAVGSKEDRQFLRWTAQVLLTEELCRVELARLGAGRSAREPRVLSQAESLHLGSINAAAWSRAPEMSELFDLVTAPTTMSEPPAPRRTWYRVTHAVGATPLAAEAARPRALGWTTLADLPTTLAAELRAMPTGIRVGPVRSGIGWHFATVTATEVRADPRPGLSGGDPARLAAFNRWLDQRRRALVTHVEGFEHPGDPSQPDNTHRH